MFGEPTWRRLTAEAVAARHRVVGLVRSPALSRSPVQAGGPDGRPAASIYSWRGPQSSQPLLRPSPPLRDLRAKPKACVAARLQDKACARTLAVSWVPCCHPLPSSGTAGRFC